MFRYTDLIIWIIHVRIVFCCVHCGLQCSKQAFTVFSLWVELCWVFLFVLFFTGGWVASTWQRWATQSGRGCARTRVKMIEIFWRALQQMAAIPFEPAFIFPLWPTYYRRNSPWKIYTFIFWTTCFLHPSPLNQWRLIATNHCCLTIRFLLLLLLELFNTSIYVLAPNKLKDSIIVWNIKMCICSFYLISTVN